MNPLAALLANLSGSPTGQGSAAQQTGAPAGGGLFAALLDAANGTQPGLLGEFATDPSATAAGTQIPTIEDLTGLLGPEIEALIIPEDGTDTELAIDAETATATEAGLVIDPLLEGEGESATAPLPSEATSETDEAPTVPTDGAPGAAQTETPAGTIAGTDIAAQPAPPTSDGRKAAAPQVEPTITAPDAAPAQNQTGRDGVGNGVPRDGGPPGGQGLENADARVGHVAGHAAARGGQGQAGTDGAETPARPIGPTDADANASRLASEAGSDQRRVLPSAEQRPAQTSEARAADRLPIASDPDAAGREAQNFKADRPSASEPQNPVVLRTVANAATGQALIQLQEQPGSDASPLARGDGQTLAVQLRPAASNASPTPAPTPQVPVQGLAVHIAQQAQNGARRFDIRMDPPELGRIEVRLDVARDGQVTTHLVVERSETLDLLQRDARSLERALQDAGLNTSEDGMKFSLKDQGLAHGESQDADGEAAKGPGDPDDEAAPSHDEQSPPPDQYIATTGLDIRI